MMNLGSATVKQTSLHTKTVAINTQISKLTGTYFLGVRIQDPDGHVRYTYAVHAIHVLPANASALPASAPPVASVATNTRNIASDILFSDAPVV
jgi:hypothetical protein